ncbi:hypothetical protein BD324DRAFT_680800 [Kockovaella imperatae]|uniref:Uncharacterized protein n=1 Tax=Kockovaella imperatae TaxID=4999 RepID=A0A1Y1UIX8_9TREE|nr:hypothetical protein BD324DRAFT_680800 [Kockovaella imperatae]ORX37929.1 hypothetical protein BD324DRAFT_680800 [Kockovaella imperatae]
MTLDLVLSETPVTQDILARETVFEDTVAQHVLDGVLSEKQRLFLEEKDRSLNAVKVSGWSQYWKVGADGKDKRNLQERKTPSNVIPYKRCEVVKYYQDHPVRPHVSPTYAGANVTMVTCLGDGVESAGNTSISSLEIIPIAHLQCPKRHDGRVLYCRVLTLPKLGIGIAFAIEDISGDALVVSLQAPFDSPALTKPFKECCNLFPWGSTLAIKEPYVHYSLTTGLPEIQVAVLTDVVILPGEVVMNWAFRCPFVWRYNDLGPLQLKETANELYSAGKYEDAEQLYALALQFPRHKLSMDLEVSLRLNRILVLSHLHRYGQVLRECLMIEDSRQMKGKSILSTAQSRRLYIRMTEAAHQLGLPGLAQAKFKRFRQFCDVPLTSDQKMLVTKWLSLLPSQGSTSPMQPCQSQTGHSDGSDGWPAHTQEGTERSAMTGPKALNRRLALETETQEGDVVIMKTKTLTLLVSPSNGVAVRLFDAGQGDAHIRQPDHLAIFHALINNPILGLRAKLMTQEAIDSGKRMDEAQEFAAFKRGINTNVEEIFRICAEHGIFSTQSDGDTSK